MEKKSRIALVTTWYPPVMSVATNRMIAFTSYLSESFEIEVFCLSPGKSYTENDPVKVFYQENVSVFNVVRARKGDAKFIHIFKTVCRILLGKIIKDPLKDWRKKTVAQLTQRHKKSPFDLIISSFAPHEAHQVVLQFLAENGRIPWIADMRDEMSVNVNYSMEQQQMLREIEAQINSFATAITSVSAPIVEGFQELCPNVKHFLEIRNGYNHSFVRLDDDINDRSGKTLQLGYFGNFYGTRKPTVLFEALVELLKRIEGFDFHLSIYGAHNNFEIPEVLKDRVKLFPELMYTEAIARMAEMDANIMIHPASSQKGVFTGKLFDYLSVRRSVLALVDPEDVAAELVQSTGAGYIADCLNLESNITAIEALYSDFLSGRMRMIRQEDAELLHRKNQVKKLSTFIKTELGL